MEIQIPLETALLWLGVAYDPEFDIYQIEFGGSTLHVQVFNNYASVVSAKEFSVSSLTENSDHFRVVAAY